MCYDVSYLTRKQHKYAQKFGETREELDRLENQLNIFLANSGPVFHTTAFDHWELPVITSEKPKDFQFFHWGLIPHFVKNTAEYSSKYTSRYLNSRIETLFDKKIYNEQLGKELDNPFYSSASTRRCIVVLDGYYDWHWIGKNAYNFHVLLKSEEPLLVAGIWRKWISKTEDIEKNTVSLITTEANELCKYVHNKPKASEGPRQLAILEDEQAKAWIDSDLPEDRLKKILRVYPESKMVAYPVKKLFRQEGRSRISLKDSDCMQEVKYPELIRTSSNQGSLF